MYRFHCVRLRFEHVADFAAHAQIIQSTAPISWRRSYMPPCSRILIFVLYRRYHYLRFYKTRRACSELCCACAVESSCRLRRSHGTAIKWLLLPVNTKKLTGICKAWLTVTASGTNKLHTRTTFCTAFLRDYMSKPMRSLLNATILALFLLHSGFSRHSLISNFPWRHQVRHRPPAYGVVAEDICKLSLLEALVCETYYFPRPLPF